MLSLRPYLASIDPSNTQTTVHMCKLQEEIYYRKEFDSMLALAWMECFLPIFLWVGNCVFAGVGDKKFKLAGTALCGLLSLIAGPMYLTWYYQCKFEVNFHKYIYLKALQLYQAKRKQCRIVSKLMFLFLSAVSFLARSQLSRLISRLRMFLPLISRFL